MGLEDVSHEHWTVDLDQCRRFLLRLIGALQVLLILWTGVRLALEPDPNRLVPAVPALLTLAIVSALAGWRNTSAFMASASAILTLVLVATLPAWAATIIFGTVAIVMSAVIVVCRHRYERTRRRALAYMGRVAGLNIEVGTASRES